MKVKIKRLRPESAIPKVATTSKIDRHVYPTY